MFEKSVIDTKLLIVNQAIEGLKQALLIMPEGSLWRIFIPTELAYGKIPFPNSPVEPNMALIYDIELISVIKKQ